MIQKAGEFVAVLLDGGVSTSQKSYEQYKVHGTPTVILADFDGSEMGRPPLASADGMLKKMDEVLGKFHEKYPKKGKPAPAASFTAEMKKVYPWVNAMPGPDGPKAYVIAEVQLENKTRKDLKVELEKATLTFEGDAEGAPIEGFSIKGEDGRPSGQKTLTLHPGEKKVVEFRGDGLYDPDKAGKKMQVALTLASKTDKATVRGSATVETAQ